MVNNTVEGMIKFVTGFTSVIMTNWTRWQARLHEVEVQNIHSWAKTAMFFLDTSEDCYWQWLLLFSIFP